MVARNQRVSDRWPCFFREPWVHDHVDPFVRDRWLASYGTRAPFGDLRNTWRREHCRTLNPYGSDTCRARLPECAKAFCDAVSLTARHKPNRAGGYFRKVARTDAAKRADILLTRGIQSDSLTHREALDAQRPGNERSPTEGTEQGPRVRSSEDRPVSIGDVFRSLDLGPRKEGTPDGTTSTE